MIQTQRLTASLTPLDVALENINGYVQPVAPVSRALAEALGCVAAQMPSLRHPLPAFSVAVSDGWALRANDIVGASSYSPLHLASPPIWVEAGGRLPEGCDCVVAADLIEQVGGISQVVGEVVPGHGVRRAGEDMRKGARPVAEGLPVSPLQLLAAKAAGLDMIDVRAPRIRLVNVPGATGEALSSKLIERLVRASGADISVAQAKSRDAEAIDPALDVDGCDLLLLIGGTGEGRTDFAIKAIAARGEVLAHGIALLPARTSAIGRIGTVPVIALPGTPHQAFAAWLALAQPVLDGLSGRVPRNANVRPLARKIASAVGFSEIALLKAADGMWMPLATGSLSLDAIATAEAWMLVPANSEGFAAGSSVGALVLTNA